MNKKIGEEYEAAVKKRNEIKGSLNKLLEDSPEDLYNVTITRDRLAYWEGKTEGLKFALDHIKENS
ncbi:MAG: hypothetical protein V3V59_00705 [Thermodesulfovibrionales bacterium]